MRVPFVDLTHQTALVRERTFSAWNDMFDRQGFVLGEGVRSFEERLAEYFNADSAIGVANGGDALEIAMVALGIGAGDEVLLPGNSYAATAMAVQNIGATPVLIDVDTDTSLIDVSHLDGALSSKSKAVIPVHLFGQMAPMQEIVDFARAHDLSIIEDAAQAHGATQSGMPVGTLSDAACLSFYPGKNLGAFGDGGAILTSNTEVADRVRKIRNYGGVEKYEHSIVGRNSRLDEVQALALNIKLDFLDQWNAQRQELADHYLSAMSNFDHIDLPVVCPMNTHVWHLFVIRSSRRDDLREFLSNRNVQTQIHYPHPLSELNGTLKTSGTPTCELLSKQILSLPMFPGMTGEQLEQVVTTIADFQLETTAL